MIAPEVSPEVSTADSAENGRVEQARDRLRTALDRLEKAVENRVADAVAAVKSAPSAEQEAMLEQHAQLKATLEETERALRHLREENATLQQMLGSEREQNFELKKMQSALAGRVDHVIHELKVAMRRGAA